MDPLLQFLLALAVILVATKGAGYLSTRLGWPAVLGELLVGLILGPTVLDMLHWPMFGDEHLGEILSHLAHLGVLFLMFITGLEVDFEAMIRAGQPAVLAGVMGVVDDENRILGDLTLSHVLRYLLNLTAGGTNRHEAPGPTPVGSLCQTQ
jgi:Kef-type K+ transport system membrane component KefB